MILDSKILRLISYEKNSVSTRSILGQASMAVIEAKSKVDLVESNGKLIKDSPFFIIYFYFDAVDKENRSKFEK